MRQRSDLELNEFKFNYLQDLDWYEFKLAKINKKCSLHFYKTTKQKNLDKNLKIFNLKNTKINKRIKKNSRFLKR